ncbi:flavin monoamine oxidase family [Paramuricea clavata]|uniref:Flavin monoamine oxidase family n=2 Tax=Paramuricea clavata TaxID=317549 RepID=A0A6S7GGL6_PARCT|nr:flavin monoamine oxidase family [Paramuricea clavata]
MATSYMLDHRRFWAKAKPLKTRILEGSEVIQQSDYLKDFLLLIQSDGLEAAYLEYGDDEPRPPPPESASLKSPKDVTYDYDVIVVGAGMAGLSAAYELKKAGLSVIILEQTDRYGGRLFTYGPESGLAPGLFGEAGAMRLPGNLAGTTERPHFLTDAYIKEFSLAIKAFPNYDANGLTHIYGFPTEKSNEWEEHYFNRVWPNWKDGMHNDMKEKIKDIGAYYDETTKIVTDQLKTWLRNAPDIDHEMIVWKKWINIWSQFTLESFLRSNIDVIYAKVPEECRQDLDVDTLAKLLPWSNDAVRGYAVFTYTPFLDNSLVQYLRDQLGHWWSPDMHCLVGGMHSLADGFFSDDVLKTDDLVKHAQAFKFSYYSVPWRPKDDWVKVSCYAKNDQSLPDKTYTARAVIVTTTVNILRQLTFEPLVEDKNAKHEQRKSLQAIDDINTAPSTKIFLQTQTRFWEDAKYNIQGGFSKTNLPIGQIHYVKPDPEYVESTKQGIILVYTWNNDALIFGSMTKDQVKKEAIEQVKHIHKEIMEENMVEKSVVHAWYNQPSYQGAFGFLKTSQFNNVRTLWEPMGNVHFAGETLSFAAGWIQGALESGLKAAYQVYARGKKRTTRKEK